MSDDELLVALMYDIWFQYALHTTSYIEQPLNDSSRFQEQCNTYEAEHGINLHHETVDSLFGRNAGLMKVDFSLTRMDSLMFSSNIREMGRLELLYTCVANLAKEYSKTAELPKSMHHYIEAGDRNRVIYHNHSDETSEKTATVLKDAAALKELCGDAYEIQ